MEWLREYLSYNSETGMFTRLKIDSPNLQRFVGMTTGNINCRGYVDICVCNKSYSAHKLAWWFHYGFWPDFHIDHIDGSKVNNRIDNLRESSPLENMRNRARNKNNTSGYMGVYLQPNGKWRVRIKVEGKMINYGTHENFNDALAARRLAEREHGFHENHGKRLTVSSPNDNLTKIDETKED